MSTIMSMNDVFKQCPMCSTVWPSLDDFIDDCTLQINGYQVDFERLEYGLFYFTHITDACGSTLSVEAKEFLHLNPNEHYPERKTGKAECLGYCLDKETIDRCHAHCECAFVRDIIHILQTRREPGFSRQALETLRLHTQTSVPEK